MSCSLSNKCAKNLCKQTVLVQLIIKNVVTCFFGTQCSTNTSTSRTNITSTSTTSTSCTSTTSTSTSSSTSSTTTSTTGTSTSSTNTSTSTITSSTSTSISTTSTSTTTAKYILHAHRYISDSLIVGTTVVHMHCLRSRLYSIS